MTDHPCKGMRANVVAVFERIAIGQPPVALEKTLKRLVERGLIERIADRRVGRDCFGPVIIPQYQVPLLVHMQWCQWASEQSFDEEVPA